MSTSIQGHEPSFSLRIEPSIIDGADLFVGAFGSEGVVAVHVTRADFIAAVETELGVIVIDRAELPFVEPEVEGFSGYVGLDGEGSVATDPTPLLASAAQHREQALRHLALADYLEANPPVDEAKVRALAADVKRIANDLMDEAEGPLPLTELARRLLATGRIEVTS